LPLTPYFKPLLLRQLLQRILSWQGVVGVVKQAAVRGRY
jgi:hypothetical protein